MANQSIKAAFERLWQHTVLAIDKATVKNAVTYTAQTLTEEQKTQARKNIDATSAEEVLTALLPNAMGVGF